jgi:hypothetical protein
VGHHLHVLRTVKHSFQSRLQQTEPLFIWLRALQPAGGWPGRPICGITVTHAAQIERGRGGAKRTKGDASCLAAEARSVRSTVNAPPPGRTSRNTAPGMRVTGGGRCVCTGQECASETWLACAPPDWHTPLSGPTEDGSGTAHSIPRSADMPVSATPLRGRTRARAAVLEVEQVTPARAALPARSTQARTPQAANVKKNASHSGRSQQP